MDFSIYGQWSESLTACFLSLFSRTLFACSSVPVSVPKVANWGRFGAKLPRCLMLYHFYSHFRQMQPLSISAALSMLAIADIKPWYYFGAAMFSTTSLSERVPQPRCFKRANQANERQTRRWFPWALIYALGLAFAFALSLPPSLLLWQTAFACSVVAARARCCVWASWKPSNQEQLLDNQFNWSSRNDDCFGNFGLQLRERLLFYIVSWLYWSL